MRENKAQEQKRATSGLNPRAKHDLQRILAADYGVYLSDSDTEKFGVSLLRLTRIALMREQHPSS